MITIKDLEADTLQANTAHINNLSAYTICGITSDEFNALKNSTSNIQDRLTTIRNTANSTVNGWK